MGKLLGDCGGVYRPNYKTILVINGASRELLDFWAHEICISITQFAKISSIAEVFEYIHIKTRPLIA